MKEAWEEDFASTYGPLVGLTNRSILDSDTEDFIYLLKEKDLMKRPHSYSSHGFGRNSVVGRWTSTAALGGDMRSYPSDKIWPVSAPIGQYAQVVGSPVLSPPGLTGSGHRTHEPTRETHARLIQQAPVSCTLGSSSQVRWPDRPSLPSGTLFAVHPSELRQERLAAPMSGLHAQESVVVAAAVFPAT